MIPKVTVIVPIYNVEPYLPRCLDSLCRQTLQEIEIILVDDGSTDASGRIAEDYARRDDRFRVVHQENRGLSAARNRGIELAQAPYLMFVDSDDWVEPDYCRIPYGCATEHDVDMVMFRCWREGFPKGGKQTDPLPEGACSREEAMRLMYHGAGVAVWNKLYRKTLFETVRFPEGYVYEDHGTTHRLVQASDRVWVSNSLLYHYCCRKGSIVHSRSYRSMMDWLKMGWQEAEDLKTLGYEDLYEEAVDRVGFSYLIYRGTHAEQSGFFLKYYRTKRRMSEKDSWKKRVLLEVLKVSPTLFDLICILAGKRNHLR